MLVELKPTDVANQRDDLDESSAQTLNRPVPDNEIPCLATEYRGRELLPTHLSTSIGKTVATDD